MKEKRIADYSKPELEALLKTSNTYSDFLVSIGYARSSGGYRSTKSYLTKHGIDFSELQGKRHSSTSKPSVNIFVENSLTTTKVIRNRVIKESLLPYVCVGCGIGASWNHGMVIR